MNTLHSVLIKCPHCDSQNRIEAGVRNCLAVTCSRCRGPLGTYGELRVMRQEPFGSHATVGNMAVKEA